MKLNFLFVDESGTVRSGWRVVIFLFAFLLVAVFFGLVAELLLKAAGFAESSRSSMYLAVNAVSSLIPATVIGWLCGKYLEKLPFRALGMSLTSGWLKRLALGVVIGAASLSIAVLVAYIFGGLRFGLNDAGSRAIVLSLASSFLVFAVASAFEEVLFRGYILQTFARSGLAWLAILLTSVFFGAVHLGNPNANLISTLNTILAGVWFSVAYLRMRDLWFVWGLHLMWNWMQGSFFGIEVSGVTYVSTAPLLREIDTGPTWLTGTTYGVEGGIVCTVAILISIAVVYLLPRPKFDDFNQQALFMRPES